MGNQRLVIQQEEERRRLSSQTNALEEAKKSLQDEFHEHARNVSKHFSRLDDHVAVCSRHLGEVQLQAERVPELVAAQGKLDASIVSAQAQLDSHLAATKQTLDEHLHAESDQLQYQLGLMSNSLEARAS